MWHPLAVCFMVSPAGRLSHMGLLISGRFHCNPGVMNRPYGCVSVYDHIPEFQVVTSTLVI